MATPKRPARHPTKVTAGTSPGGSTGPGRPRQPPGVPRPDWSPPAKPGGTRPSGTSGPQRPSSWVPFPRNKPREPTRPWHVLPLPDEPPDLYDEGGGFDPFPSGTPDDTPFKSPTAYAVRRVSTGKGGYPKGKGPMKGKSFNAKARFR